MAIRGTPRNPGGAKPVSEQPENQVAKQIFGVPSLETATRIDNEDMVAAMHAAHYRLTARMRELEFQFEQKAAELRQAFIGESNEILSRGAE